MTSNYFVEVRYCCDCEHILLEWLQVTDYEIRETTSIKSLPNGSHKLGQWEQKDVLKSSTYFTCSNCRSREIRKIYIRLKMSQWLEETFGTRILCELTEEEINEAYIQETTIRRRLLAHLLRK